MDSPWRARRAQNRCCRRGLDDRTARLQLTAPAGVLDHPHSRRSLIEPREFCDSRNRRQEPGVEPRAYSSGLFPTSASTRGDDREVMDRSSGC